MKRFFKTNCPVLALAAVIALTARADEMDLINEWPEHELEFARLVYSDNGTRYWGGAWDTDWPEAEFFFPERGLAVCRESIWATKVPWVNEAS